MLVSLAKAAVRLNGHHGSSAGAEVEELVRDTSDAMSGWKVNLKKWSCTECGSEGNFPSHKWCYACGATRVKPASAAVAAAAKDKDKEAKPDSEKPNTSKLDQLAERIRSLQLAKEAIKDFKDDAAFCTTWHSLESQIADCKRQVSESKPVGQQLATMERIITKKEERIVAIEKQIRTLSDESDSLNAELQTLKDTKGKLEAKQVGLLQREIGEAQTTYALMLPLVDRLAAINAMNDLDAMKRSIGEVMESAAKLAAGAKDAKDTEADQDAMETDGGPPRAAAAEIPVDAPARASRSGPSRGPAPATPANAPEKASASTDVKSPGTAMGPFKTRRLETALSDPYPPDVAGFRAQQEEDALI